MTTPVSSTRSACLLAAVAVANRHTTGRPTVALREVRCADGEQSHSCRNQEEGGSLVVPHRHDEGPQAGAARFDRACGLARRWPVDWLERLRAGAGPATGEVMGW